MSHNLVTVQTCYNQIDAEIIRGRLSSAGINAFIVKDDCGGTDPMMQAMFGVKVKVDYRDEKNALEIIKRLRLHTKQTNVFVNGNKASMASFIILMINATGTGILLSGFVYYESLIFYGLILLILGSAAFLARFLIGRWEKGKKKEQRRKSRGSGLHI